MFHIKPNSKTLKFTLLFFLSEGVDLFKDQHKVKFWKLSIESEYNGSEDT